MEGNRDTALMVKEIAEKKLLQKDLGGARLFARRAHDFYPELDGLPQLLATIEVHIAGENKVNGGEVDWYRVLGLQPFADDETIRKRYRKLALALHPDKNKSVGADGAFNLISQAWSLLSDKAKRAAYDSNYRLWSIHRGIPGGKPAIPTSRNNGFYNTFNTDDGKARDQRSVAHPNPAPGPPATSDQTFWTKCSSCRLHCEYPAVYKNSYLICVKCKKPFLASEVQPPPAFVKVSSTSSISQMQQQNFNSTRMERGSHVSGRRPVSAVNSSLGSGIFSVPGGISNVQTSASTASEAPGVFRMSSENLKRRREDSTPVMWEEVHLGKPYAVERTVAGSAFQSSFNGSNPVLKGDGPMKKCRTDELHKFDSDRSGMEAKVAFQKATGLANEFGSQKNGFYTRKVNAAGNHKPNGIRDGSQQMKSMLMVKARNVIRKQLDEWRASSVSKNLNKPNNTDTEVREKNKDRAINGMKPPAKEFVDSETIGKKCLSTDSELPPSVSFTVPDPDFHDFDGDRIEDSFGENQVWAIYDEDDGMPRYYALIHSVISKNPFQMKISWLSCKTNDEFAPINWISSGFPKTTGDFRPGKRDIYSTLNSFSHMVKWTKGSRGAVHIYPKKGDVWALYRNWSADWNELTKDEIIHEYDMVEVLEDYSEEKGVNVAPLLKVAGFKTVFRQNADPRKIRNIPKEEMFRFSHQVPSYSLTGEEGHNAPKGFVELDPASTPMELLQLVTETAKQEMEMTNEKSLKDELRPEENSRVDGSVLRGPATEGEDSAEGVPRNEVAEELANKPKRPEILIVYERKRKRVKS